jgi:hypothetical protein
MTQANERVVQRVLELGGPLADYGKVPALDMYEEIFRTEPNDAWFDPARSPSNVIQFEMAAVTSKKSEAILIFDYSVRPFGFSGIGVGDTLPMPEGYLSGAFGYVIRVGGQPTGVVKYRLNPTAPGLDRVRFKFNKSPLTPATQKTASDFSRSRANSFASASGFGGEIHPQSPGRFGARNVPFMIVVGDGIPLEVTGIIFNEITLPVPFIEVRLSGYKTSATVAQNLISELDQTVR